MRVTDSKYFLASAAALLAVACSDHTTAPRGVTPSDADFAVVAVYPPLPVGSTLQQTIGSGTGTHYCAFNSTNNPLAGTFPGTDCATNANDLTTPLTTYNPGWDAPFASSAWIGPTAPDAPSNQYVAHTGSYEYIQTFTVPAGKAGLALQLDIKSDNAVVVYLNGTEIGRNTLLQDCPVEQTNCNWTNASALKITGTPVIGANTLRIDVVGTPIGFELSGTPRTTCADGPQKFGVGGVPTPQKRPIDGGTWDVATCFNPTGVNFVARVYYFTPAVTTWCSPGFWKNHDSNPPWPTTAANVPYQNLLYNSFAGQYANDPQTFAGFDFGPNPKKQGSQNPTLLEVISNPNIYGGPATNNVADILSNKVFGTPIGQGVESCPF